MIENEPTVYDEEGANYDCSQGYDKDGNEFTGKIKSGTYGRLCESSESTCQCTEILPEPDEDDEDPQPDGPVSGPLVTSGGEQQVDDEDSGIVWIIIGCSAAAICIVLVIIGIKLCRKNKDAKSSQDTKNDESFGTSKMSHNNSQEQQLQNEQVSVLQ